MCAHMCENCSDACALICVLSYMCTPVDVLSYVCQSCISPSVVRAQFGVSCRDILLKCLFSITMTCDKGTFFYFTDLSCYFTDFAARYACHMTSCHHGYACRQPEEIVGFNGKTGCLHAPSCSQAEMVDYDTYGIPNWFSLARPKKELADHEKCLWYRGSL